MGQNYITESRVLDKFTKHGYGSTVRQKARSMGLKILAGEFDEQMKQIKGAAKPAQTRPSNLFRLIGLHPEAQPKKLPMAFDPAYQPKASTPTNMLHDQRLAMLVMLVETPHLANTMGISSNDMADLKQCFDPAWGGSDRYQKAYTRLAAAITAQNASRHTA